MNDPVLFGKCNNLPRRDAKEFLEAKAFKIKWKEFEDRSLDIGSANAGVTMEILRNYLPVEHSKLVGCDISDSMVQYANQRYNDYRTCFIKHDITSDVPKEMQHGFDHVFSFYTLHWVQNQRLCMSNIWSLLDNGGDCLLMILSRSPIYDVYRLLAKNPRWSLWLVNAEHFVSPYQDSLEPEKELRVILEETGFQNVEVSCEHRSYFYTDVNFLKETMAGICPFKIPKDLMEIYLEDYVQTAVKNNLMEEIFDMNGKFLGLNYMYSLLWVYASKP